MKKTLLALAIFFSLNHLLLAQGDLYYGIQFTPTISKLTFAGIPDKEEYKNIASSCLTSSFGILGEYALSKRITVQSGLNFSQVGENRSTTEFGANSKTKIRLRYLEIPALFKYYTYKQIYFVAGVSGSFLLSGKAKNTLTYDNGETENYNLNIANLRKFNTFINLGVGYKIPLNYFSFSLQPTLSYSLTNLYDSKSWNRHSISYGLTIALRFGRDKKPYSKELNQT